MTSNTNTHFQISPKKSVHPLVTLHCHQLKAWVCPGDTEPVLTQNLKTPTSFPDPAGPVPVQTPERGWADAQPRGLHLCGPHAAGGSQRGLGDRDLAADGLPGLPAGELHGASQRVWHLGETQVSAAPAPQPTCLSWSHRQCLSGSLDASRSFHHQWKWPAPCWQHYPCRHLINVLTNSWLSAENIQKTSITL